MTVARIAVSFDKELARAVRRAAGSETTSSWLADAARRKLRRGAAACRRRVGKGARGVDRCGAESRRALATPATAQVSRTVLDSGALLALERNDRAVWAALKLAALKRADV